MFKRNYWPLFFIGIFSFTFAMIIWTIISSSKANIEEDESFFKSYQEVDASFNRMMNSNKIFLDKYRVEIILNSKTFPLQTEDIMYSQRVLKKKKRHRDLLKIGQNDLVINIYDKKTNEKLKFDVKLKVTKSNSKVNDILLTNESFENKDNTYINKFEIKEENNWNLTGSFTIGNDKGYLYMKTNAI